MLAGLAAGAAATRALRAGPTEDPLQQLIEQNQRGDLGQGFDSASRTIRMPKASLPTLSPANMQTTEAAIARYEQVVAAAAGRRSRRPTACAPACAIRRCLRCVSG